MFSANIIDALGLGLTNSIWFGLFGYAALKVLNTLIGEDKPEVKYYISSSILVIILFLTIYSIAHLAGNSNYISANGKEYLRISYSTDQNIYGIKALLQVQFVKQLLVGLNEIILINIIPILTSWAAGVLLLSVRYSLAFRVITRAKSHVLRLADAGLNRTVNKIQKKMGMSRSIEVAESTFITVPSVIGILKPIVLLPVGIISSIPAEQIELILAHEFAHIKRLDPVFRLVQSVIEILLFFNPFIWLISKAIDSEREKCCDDSALLVCNNRLALAKALHSIAEYNMQSGIALGFSGNSSGLIHRIKRILKADINNSRSSAGSALSFAATTILSIILFSASLGTSFSNQKKADNNNVIQANVYGSVKNGDEIINILKNKFGRLILPGETDQKTIPELSTEIRSQEDISNEISGFAGEELAERINKLIGNESKFENIMEKLEVDLSALEQFNIPKFSEKFELSEKIDFSFDFDQDWDIEDMNDLKSQITEIQKSIKKLQQN